MKLRDLINPDKIGNDNSVIPMFNISEERWDEIAEMTVAVFDSCSSFSESVKVIDEHFTLNGEHEVLAVMFILASEKGRLEGEQATGVHGLEIMKNRRIGRLRHSADYLKTHNIPFSDYFKKILKAKPSPVVRDLEDIIGKILKGLSDENVEVRAIGGTGSGHPLSNKNKFKKDGFDIPDPNKKSDSEGNEPNKES